MNEMEQRNRVSSSEKCLLKCDPLFDVIPTGHCRIKAIKKKVTPKIVKRWDGSLEPFNNATAVALELSLEDLDPRKFKGEGTGYLTVNFKVSDKNLPAIFYKTAASEENWKAYESIPYLTEREYEEGSPEERLMRFREQRRRWFGQNILKTANFESAFSQMNPLVGMVLYLGSGGSGITVDWQLTLAASEINWHFYSATTELIVGLKTALKKMP